MCPASSYPHTTAMTLQDLTSLMRGLANAVAVLHLAFFLFVVGGTAAIFTAPRLARNVTFRLLHVLAVFIVLAETAMAIECPLNTAQAALRTASGGQAQATSGFAGLLDMLLYRTIDGNVLNAMYQTLGVVLPILLIAVPPAWRGTRTTVEGRT